MFLVVCHLSVIVGMRDVWRSIKYYFTKNAALPLTHKKTLHFISLKIHHYLSVPKNDSEEVQSKKADTFEIGFWLMI